jgi:hypothetical protein
VTESVLTPNFDSTLDLWIYYWIFCNCSKPPTLSFRSAERKIKEVANPKQRSKSTFANM